MKIIIKTVFIFFLLTNYSHAYIDPGTGSIILHAIIAFIAGCITWIIAKYKKFKSFISNFKKNKNKS